MFQCPLASLHRPAGRNPSLSLYSWITGKLTTLTGRDHRMSSRPAPSSRPLDALAIAVTIGLCLSWGFNNVAIKIAIHDIPPLIQSASRSVLAAIVVGIWTQLRGIPLFRRDGSLLAGILAGVFFALEFILI